MKKRYQTFLNSDNAEYIEKLSKSKGESISAIIEQIITKERLREELKKEK